MRKFRNALIALIVASGTAALAANGIEVLSAMPTPHGIEVLSLSPNCPLGSYVEAVMNIGGPEIVVFTAPVDPATGLSLVVFPENHPGNRVVLRAPSGAFLASADGWVTVAEFD